MLNKINFYSIINGNYHKVLINLIEKLQKEDINTQIAIIASDDVERDYIDVILWTSAIWMPHCIFGDKYQNQSSIIIYNANEIDNINDNMHHIFILNTSPSPSIIHNNRYFIIFNGESEDALRYNRQRWKDFTNKHYELFFFQQEKNDKFIELKK